MTNSITVTPYLYRHAAKYARHAAQRRGLFVLSSARHLMARKALNRMAARTMLTMYRLTVRELLGVTVNGEHHA